MDDWHRFDQQHDEVRKWAELEGKSPLMTDDLCRRYAPSKDQSDGRPIGGRLLTQLVARAAKTWRRITGR